MDSKKTVGIEWTQASEAPCIIPLHPSAPAAPKRPRSAFDRSPSCDRPVPIAEETVAEAQMYRLPRYDSKTRRFEFGVFLGLGLTALALIGPALLESGRFAENRDAITDALVSGQPDSTELACCPTNHGATNVTVVPAKAHSDRAS
jgi:hypothetical protein